MKTDMIKNRKKAKQIQKKFQLINFKLISIIG